MMLLSFPFFFTFSGREHSGEMSGDLCKYGFAGLTNMRAMWEEEIQ